MSIVYCEYCDKHIDLDFNAEHFPPEGDLSTCMVEVEEKGLCTNCGSKLVIVAADDELDEVYYECPGCGS